VASEYDTLIIETVGALVVFLNGGVAQIFSVIGFQTPEQPTIINNAPADFTIVLPPAAAIPAQGGFLEVSNVGPVEAVANWTVFTSNDSDKNILVYDGAGAPFVGLTVLLVMFRRIGAIG
jgi:hypothetical protein